LFDLKPVRLSARSSYVKFTDEIEQALSSQRHLERLNAPVVVAYGTLETPEFQRQSRDFAAAVRAAGKPVQLLVGEGYNHFEIPETLANPTVSWSRGVGADAPVPRMIPVPPNSAVEQTADSHSLARGCSPRR
jgi:acetyl esterase/lipase